MKIADYQRGIKREHLSETTRTEGFLSQGQSIDFGIINPRDRATHGVKREKICRTAGRLAEVRIKSRTITNLYLTGDLNSWNNAKKAEEHERVKHGVDNYVA